MKKLKVILTIVFATLLFIAVPVYSTKAQIAPATDSVTQTLTVNVLPAFEQVEFKTQYTSNVLEIVASKTIAVRSNTSWDLQFYSWSYGFVNPSSCYVKGNVGLSNGQAGVGDNYQYIELICIQPRSWGDKDNAQFDIYYSTNSEVSL
jgi:hypothetical protein